MTPLPVLAYLDPGAGSLVLQALIGGGAGFFVFLRHLWKTYRAGGTTAVTGRETTR
jgi:hypothetical protein